jgi:ribosomal protein L11 methyltransferase
MCEGLLGVAFCEQIQSVQEAVDVDPVAVHATSGSVALNGCGDRCGVHLAEAASSGVDPLVADSTSVPAGEFDLLVANLLKPPLLDLKERFLRYLKPGGHLILSGMLPSQVISFALTLQVTLSARLI